MKDTANAEKVKDFIEKYSGAVENIYSCVELNYDDQENYGLFGFDSHSFPEPFFGLFWCKSDGNQHSNRHDYDMNVTMSIAHAKQIYEFLKKIFEQKMEKTE